MRSFALPPETPTEIADTHALFAAKHASALDDLTHDPPDPPQVAGFDLVRLLGRGGMGVVWEAIEHRFDRRVALKVHSTATEHTLVDALWTEALVAARIDDPSIVRVLDVGRTLDGRPYYAMELVQGTDLAAILADGPLAPRRALAIAADMARAAAAVHQHGVVHRDIKPRNVIVDGTGRARVLDFGIALDARREDDPFKNRLAGSPPYMAPEQVTGEPIGPWTDIWAIGVILYEMLAGERPFSGGSKNEVFDAIVRTDPEPPSSREPGVHVDLDHVVARCITKNPAGRFPSAVALFETLTAIAEGRPVDLGGASRSRSGAYVPRAPSSVPSNHPRREDAKKHLDWSWRLSSSPEALWLYVSDTDRFNKAVGLAPVLFTDRAAGSGRVERTGENRVLGLTIRWRELPFEWIKDREHSVFRVYESGPIATLWNRVRLVPLPGGGTELHHEIWLSPRGIVGEVAAFVELQRRLSAAVDRFYRHLDGVLCAGTGADPFEDAHSPTHGQKESVEAGIAALRSAGFGGELVDRIAAHLLHAPNGVARVLRPYALADAWGADRAETLDLMLHGARASLLEPAWELICPRCRIAHETVADLDHVKQHGSCAACAAEFERDLCDTVELVFVPHPSVRAIVRQTFCAGSPARRPHVVLQQILDPGETRRVQVTLAPGAYQLTAGAAKWELVVSAVGFAAACEATFGSQAGEAAGGGRPAEADRIDARPTVLRAGPVDFLLSSAVDADTTVRLEMAGERGDAVSAAAALTHPSFRAFYSKQLLAYGEHVSVRHMAFVFVEPLSPEGIYGRLGDGPACAELARLEERISSVAQRHEGEIVPSALGGLVVAFATSLRALHAAIALRMRLREADPAFLLQVGIGVHGGRCIALTRAGRPEFFGHTLHRGAALAPASPPDGLALSGAVIADRAVAAVAYGCSDFSVVVDTAPSGPYAGRRIAYLVPAPLSGAAG